MQQEHEFHGLPAGQLRHPGDGHGDRGGEPPIPAASQRTDGFRGGVQAGTSATSAESGGHERNLRAVAKRLDGAGLVWRSGYTASELGELLGVEGYHLQGVQPDGGVWTKPGSLRPVVAAEAKKQGEAGNAIERWYKNWDVLRVLGVEVYVTFCVGDGFFDQNAAQKTLETAVALHEQRSAGSVWNTQDGRLWMYRYRSAAEAAAEMDDVLAAAIARATAL
jgi:hypothetical protein